MTIKRRFSRLVFKPDARAAALEPEAWALIISEVRKVQTTLSVEIEDEGFESTIRRIIDFGTPCSTDCLGRRAMLIKSPLPRSWT